LVAVERRPKILVVDDEVDNLELLVRSLRGDFEVLTATSGAEALKVLSGNDVSVIVTDQRMPGMTGVQFLREAAQQRPGAKRLLLTAYADADSLIQAINAGQVHYYVRKPWDSHQLHATVAELVHLRRLEDENKKMFEELQRANRELGEHQRLLSRDLDDRGQELLAANSQLRAANDSLAKMAFRDGLTGLYNHRTFQERLREEVARSLRYGQPCSLLFMDLDHFKAFNDKFGHPSGDEVLKAAGRLLLGQLDSEVSARESDVAARYGGEELVLILPETNRAGAVIKAERLRQAVTRLTFSGKSELVTMSFGVAECPTDAKVADDLLVCADQALYRAKHLGRNRVEAFGDWAKEGAAPPAPVSAALPSFFACAQKAEAILRGEGHLAVLYIDVADLAHVEREYGSAMYSDLLSRLAPAISSISPEVIRENDVFAAGYQDQASFVVFLSGPRPGGHPPSPEGMRAICERVARHTQLAADRELAGLVRVPIRVAVGHSLSLGTRRSPVDRQVAQLVREAASSARLERERAEMEEKMLLQHIILSGRLHSVYQPIVHAAGSKVLGYEALVRGPAGTAMESATPLLNVALRCDLQWEFDAACIRTALAGAIGLKPEMTLFLNVLPPTFFDRGFASKELASLCKEAGFAPSRVVLEVTEQFAVTDLDRLRNALEAVRLQGFRIALDDVGAAQANLQQIQTLRPDFIKLDLSIVNGLAGVPERCELVKSLVKVGQGFGAQCVAEGVEREADFSALRDAGVQYVQGYYFAHPGPPFPEVAPASS
jgi:diguanylate cyclase (GGDEF)-like protein